MCVWCGRVCLIVCLIECVHVVCLRVCVFVCVFMCLFVCLFLCVCVCLLFASCLFVSVFVCLFACLLICVCVCDALLLARLLAFCLSACLYVCLSACIYRNRLFDVPFHKSDLEHHQPSTTPTPVMRFTASLPKLVQRPEYQGMFPLSMDMSIMTRARCIPTTKTWGAYVIVFYCTSASLSSRRL